MTAELYDKTAALYENEEGPHPNPLQEARGLRHRGMFSIVSHRTFRSLAEGKSNTQVASLLLAYRMATYKRSDVCLYP